MSVPHRALRAHRDTDLRLADPVVLRPDERAIKAQLATLDAPGRIKSSLAVVALRNIVIPGIGIIMLAVDPNPTLIPLIAGLLGVPLVAPSP